MTEFKTDFGSLGAGRVSYRRAARLRSIYKEIVMYHFTHRFNAQLKRFSLLMLLGLALIAILSAPVQPVVAGDPALRNAPAGDFTWTDSSSGLLSASGTIAAVAFSPNYANDHTLFVGDQYGGLFRSTDGGATWRRVFSVAARALQAIAFSPDYVTDRTIVVGAEFVGSYNNGGVWKSIDGGETWTMVTKDDYYSDYYYGITSLAFSPNYAADRTLFAGSSAPPRNGVWKSTDAGVTWSYNKVGGIFDISIEAVVLSPAYTQDQTVFAGGSGIYKSTDGGATWRNVSRGSVSGFINASALVISPNFVNDRTLFAALDGLMTDAYGVLKSTDGGETWQWSDGGLPGAAGGTAPDVASLAISPNYANDHTLFTDPYGQGIWQSTDGGASWHAANGGMTTLKVLPRALAISPQYPTDGSLLAGGWYSAGRLTPGLGLWKTTNAGVAWQNLPMPNVWVEALAVSPDFDRDATVLLNDNRGQVWKSGDGGLTWTRDTSNLTGLEVHGLAFSPQYAADNVLFARTYTGLYTSADRGATWQPASFPGVYVVDLAFSPNYAVDRTVWASLAGEGVRKSTDAGATWSATYFTQTANARLAFSPNYAADRTLLVADDYELYQSTNSGATWQVTATAQSSIRALALAPDFPTYGGAWVQSDFKFCRWSAGRTDAYCEYLPDVKGQSNFLAFALAYSPNFAQDRMLLVGGLVGVQKVTLTPDGFQAEPFNEGGLAGFGVMALAFTPDKPLTVFAGMREGGVWQYSFKQTLRVTPAGITLMAKPGSAALPQVVHILSASALTVTASISPNVAWLTLAPTGVTTATTFNLSGNASGLALGTYTTTLVLDAGVEVTGSPAYVPVTFIVGDIRQGYLPLVRR